MLFSTQSSLILERLYILDGFTMKMGKTTQCYKKMWIPISDENPSKEKIFRIPSHVSGPTIFLMTHIENKADGSSILHEGTLWLVQTGVQNHTAVEK
ncbi:hypothetical protein PoB_000536500 [Plakobranchus ocellatus]|uniref:Uncharacterized protein n=1 Tax=Plakobranchus ocellatus TaxID=259542 RepID=A0AAV3Y6W4_9GAST|nr:hypothetical protein PoB_000536500 [Plakobranchus ocellatus]